MQSGVPEGRLRSASLKLIRHDSLVFLLARRLSVVFETEPKILNPILEWDGQSNWITQGDLMELGLIEPTSSRSS